MAKITMTFEDVEDTIEFTVHSDGEGDPSPAESLSALVEMLVDGIMGAPLSDEEVVG